MVEHKVLIKNYTHKGFKRLSKKDIDTLIDNNVPFSVTNLFDLGYDYYFCLTTKRLYRNNEEIALTNLENRLLNFLIVNPSIITSIDDIKSFVWKDREMSVYTMRNIIKKIRDKSYYGIIKNKSGLGYMVKTKNGVN